MVEIGSMKQLYIFWVAMTFDLGLVCSSQAIPKSAKAKFYEMPDGLGTPSGACGYGEYGRNVYKGNVAAVSSGFLYRAGAGCGACYQVKCTALECNKGGVKVVITDRASTDEAEFILSYRAFATMAKPGNEKVLKEKGIVDIQYKRIQCEYGAGESLSVKVLEQSSYPDYLAFVFLYQGGNSAITAVEIFEKDMIEWKPCSRAYGAVWHIASLPESGALTLRLFLPAGSGSPSSNTTWIVLPNAIPHPWTPGASYHTHVRIP